MEPHPVVSGEAKRVDRADRWLWGGGLVMTVFLTLFGGVVCVTNVQSLRKSQRLQAQGQTVTGTVSSFHRSSPRGKGNVVYWMEYTFDANGKRYRRKKSVRSDFGLDMYVKHGFEKPFPIEIRYLPKDPSVSGIVAEDALEPDPRWAILHGAIVGSLPYPTWLLVWVVWLRKRKNGKRKA